MMIQAFTDVGVSIDFDKLLELMADNAENISDFIQSVEFNEPSNDATNLWFEHERLIIEQNEQIQYFPRAIFEVLWQSCTAIIFCDGFEGGALMELVIICFVLIGMIAGASIKV